jgi:Regulator of Ty1 transposition protein 107 BRCT domain
MDKVSIRYNDLEAEREQALLLERPSQKRQRLLKPKLHFLFSGMDKSQMAVHISSLQQQGVVVLDEWSELCTHVIIAKPSSTEKFLSGCAKQIWYVASNTRLLKPQYIQKCLSDGEIANEEPFEWSTAADDIARAPRFWRTSKRQPFQDWNIVIRMDSAKKESFTRVLTAGGANILQSGNKETLCIVDRKFADLEMVEKKVDSIYVVNYLVKCGDVQLSMYLI